MQAKEFLKQHEKLDKIIENKLAEKEQWQDIANGITAQTGGERVQSSGSQSKMADAIAKCIDMEAEIDALVERRIVLMHEITAVLECLGATEYDVLHKRYIQYMSFYEIAATRGRDYSWATTVHGRALKNVQKIIDERKICDLV